MRILVVLSCVCALAYTRAQISESVSLNDESPVEDNLEITKNSNLESDASQVNDENEGINDNFGENSTPNPFSYVTKEDYVSEDVKSGDRKAKYQALPDQYNEESAPVSVGKLSCKEKNERYSIPGSCDKYVECLNGTAEEKQCPDGLRYNPNVKFNVYPCQYPIDVPCLARSALQPAQPTNECPHQFGYFKTGDSRNCSGFRNCVNGVGYDFTCPEGLAFSSDNYRCEWPDEVADCDAEAFLGFRCPEVPVSKELGPPAGYRTYRSSTDCQIYFICINNKPRRLSCGGFSAFDDLTESCVAADEVAACPQELRNNAARSRDAEKQRLTAVEAFEKLKYDPKELFYNSPTTIEPDQFKDIEKETQSPELE